MDQPFDVASELSGAVPVVAVGGEVDLATAPQLREELESHVDGGHARVIVDLRRTTFLDSTGLGVLVSVLKRCREEGGDLALVITEPKLVKLFEITGLEQTFPIADSIDAAVAAISGEGLASS